MEVLVLPLLYIMILYRHYISSISGSWFVYCHNDEWTMGPETFRALSDDQGDIPSLNPRLPSHTSPSLSFLTRSSTKASATSRVGTGAYR